MIDIRTIEIVTPDLQRQSLIDSNNRLKTISIFLVVVAVIAIGSYAHNYLNQERNKKL